MITLDEFKQLATDTGLMLWKNEAPFCESETTWYISYPLPMFRENCEEEEEEEEEVIYKLHSALISFAPYKEPVEISIYDNIHYDFYHLDKMIRDKEIYCYNMISSFKYDDVLKWNNKTYEEIKKEVLKIKQKVFDKQQEINLEKIKGDF